MAGRAGVTIVAAAALAIAACGGDDDGEATDSAQRFDGEKRRVAQVFEDLERATKDRDIDRICDQLISPVVVEEARKAGSDCKQGGDQRLEQELDRGGGADRYDIDVEDVRVDGDRAEAEVVYRGGARPRRERVPLVKEDDRWGVAAQGAG
jgi:ketosteroid isomerase-like protein